MSKLSAGVRGAAAAAAAILEVGTAPDFIIVDGSEGGTAAAPLEYEDHVGMPLTEGIMAVHNALVGTGLRDRIKVGASGKVAVGNDIVKRLIQGADYTNAARAMMMAIGCIQAQQCHTDKCPVGVATQSRRRQRALDVQGQGAAGAALPGGHGPAGRDHHVHPGRTHAGRAGAPHAAQGDLADRDEAVRRAVRVARTRPAPRRGARDLGGRLEAR